MISERHIRPDIRVEARRTLTAVASVALWIGFTLASADLLNAQTPAGGNATDGRAAGPCTGGTRFVDCANGTVTDTMTGLIWLKRADCFPESNWKAALSAAATLKSGDCGLTDGSSAGDWRLPTKQEWEATIAQAATLGCTFAKAPSLTNDTGTACFGDGANSSRVGVASNGYWSSTLGEIHRLLTIFPNVPVASFANLYHGDVITIESMLPFGVWPVRTKK
jgi:hypothetical protein